MSAYAEALASASAALLRDASGIPARVREPLTDAQKLQRAKDAALRDREIAEGQNPDRAQRNRDTTPRNRKGSFTSTRGAWRTMPARFMP